VRKVLLEECFFKIMWITDLRSGDKDAGTEWSEFMLARPLPARPFMSAAGLSLVTVGTVSAMLDDMGAGQRGGGGVVGGPWPQYAGMVVD
jgi:hypothetical protein